MAYRLTVAAAPALTALALAGIPAAPASAQTNGAAGSGGAASGSINTGAGQSNVPAGQGSTALGPAPGTNTKGSGINTATAAANAAVSSTPPPPAKINPPTTVPAVPLPQNPTLTPAIPVHSARNPTPLPISPRSLPPQTTFNLAQTVRLGLINSADLKVATTDLQRDAAALDVARSKYLPRINTDDTYQHLDTPTTDTIALPGFPPQVLVAEAQDKEILTLDGTLSLDVSGNIRANIQQAQLQELSDRFNRDRVYNNRVLYAQRTYFDLLRYQHQVDVDRAALQDAIAQETIAQRQFAGGVGQRVDYLSAQSQVATAQQNLFSAQNDLSNEQNSFDDLIGYSLGRQVTVIDAPGVTTGTAVSSNVAASTLASPAATADVVQVPPPSSFFIPDMQPPVPLEEGLRRAFKQRPELLEDQVNIQAANRQVQITRTNNYPKVTLEATGEYYPVTDFQTPRHSMGVYSVKVDIPLYDGGQNAAQVREERANETNAKTSYGSDKTEVELQVRQAYSNLETAARQITAANIALQEAIAARELAQVRYANGISLYEEVTDAESTLVRDETNQVNAVYAYLKDRATYENAIGAPQLGSTI